MFADRRDAGKRLARVLVGRGFEQPVVLALPRGGVPVAAEIAAALGAPFDVLVVRKVPAPDNPELTVAAIVDGDPPEIVLNREGIEACRLDDQQLQRLVSEEQPELRRRSNEYHSHHRRHSVRDRTVILVDDGVATGTTARVALRALRRRYPIRTVLAVPVGPRGAIEQLRGEADEIVCLGQPEEFAALASQYDSFPRLSDDEVIETWRATNKARAQAERRQHRKK